MSVHRLRQWLPSPTRQALNLVSKIVAANSNPGLTTQELYKLLHERKPDSPVVHQLSPPPIDKRKRRTLPPEPPHPEHPIRSIRYLKKVVLPALKAEKKVEKIHVIRPLSESELLQQQRLPAKKKSVGKSTHLKTSMIDSWVWRFPIARPVVQSLRERPKSTLASEVGFGEDYLHLNRRRRRARMEKLQRDLAKAKAFKKERDMALIGSRSTDTDPSIPPDANI